MNKKIYSSLALAILSFSALMVAPESQATPAFARQMATNCMACHTQTVPMLNAYGREFKATGFSMDNKRSEIKGSEIGINIPLAVYSGIGVKSQYVKSGAARDNVGAPVGAAIIISGKIAENAGINSMWNAEGLSHIQGIFTKSVTEKDRIGFTIFGSMGHGPFISTESYNTGLHKELLLADSVDRTNAAQVTGVGKGPSTGSAVFFIGHGLTLAGGAWTKGYNSGFTNGGIDSDEFGSSYYRAVYDLPFGDNFDLSVGAFGYKGQTTGTGSKIFEGTSAMIPTPAPWAGALVTAESQANGFDMQFNGKIMGARTAVVVNHVSNAKYKLFNATTFAAIGTATDASASSIEAQVNAHPNHGVRGGRLVYKDVLTNNDYSTVFLGYVYNYAENIRFSVERVELNYSKDTSVDFKETTFQALFLY